MTVPSSLVVMVPSPSLSKSENASLNSADEKKKKGEGRSSSINIKPTCVQQEGETQIEPNELVFRVVTAVGFV